MEMMGTIETTETYEMHAQHIDYVCGECGKAMNEPHDWYLNACDRCLNESVE